MALMFSVLAMVFIAEMGDKSQFLLVALSSKYKVKDIMIGTALAILALNLLAIALGAAVGTMIPQKYISIVAGIAFLVFAFSSLGEGEEEKALATRTEKGAILKVFGTFFLAELGDKTQLAALTLAAEHPVYDAIWVWIGACLGLYLADMLGLLVGRFLGKRLPDRAFSWISFLLFAVFGLVKLLSGMELLCGEDNKIVAIVITSAIAVAFALLCFLKLKKINKKATSE